MQEYCIHSANNYFLHADEIAKNDPHFCVIFALAFKMLLAKCTQKATQNAEKFSHIFHKRGLTFALSCCIIIIGKYGAAGAAPGAVPSAAVAPKGSSSAVSSGTPRNRAPAATLVSPVNLRILYSMKPPYTDKFLSQIRKFFRDIYEKIIYNIIKEQMSVLEIK